MQITKITTSEKYKKEKIIFNINKYYTSIQIVLYRCISINYNVVEKFIYFSNSTLIVKLVY